MCDEPAAGFHFGAFTCEGCKSFFGRSCNNQTVIQECRNNYQCIIDKKNRTACKACRLRKCLMVGMSKSGSRYGRRSNWFKIHCLMQNQQSKASPPANRLPSPLLPATSTPSISWPPPPGERQHPLLSPLGKGGLPSRSPSPLHLSLSSEGSTKSSPRSPLAADSSISPTLSSSSSLLQTSPSLHPLYPFPPPLPFLSSSAFPFYRLSPLLATNPFLANSLLFSMASNSNLQANKLESPLTSLLTTSSKSPLEEVWRPSPLPPNDTTSRPMDLTVVRPEARRPIVPTPLDEQSLTPRSPIGVDQPDDLEDDELNIVDQL